MSKTTKTTMTVTAALGLLSLSACSGNGEQSYSDAAQLHEAVDGASSCMLVETDTETNDVLGATFSTFTCSSAVLGISEWDVEGLVLVDGDVSADDLVAEYGTDPVSLVGENFIVRWDAPVAEDEEPVAQSFLEDVQAEAGGELMAPAADDAATQTAEPESTNTSAEDPRCDTRGDNYVTETAEAYASPVVTAPGPNGTGPGKESELGEFEVAEYSDTQYLVGWGVDDYAGGPTEEPDQLENAYVIVQDSNHDCSIIEMTGEKSDAALADAVIYSFLLDEPLPDDVQAAWVRFDNPDYDEEEAAQAEEESGVLGGSGPRASETVITELWNVDGGTINSDAVNLLKSSGELP